MRDFDFSFLKEEEINELFAHVLNKSIADRDFDFVHRIKTYEGGCDDLDLMLAIDGQITACLCECIQDEVSDDNLLELGSSIWRQVFDHCFDQ